MKRIIIISLLIVVLMPLAALAQATTEIKYHSYKSYAHDASDVKWAVGQSIRDYIITLDVDSAESTLISHINNFLNPHAVTAAQTSYTDTFFMGVTDVQSALDTIELWLSAIDVTDDSQDVAINALNIDMDSAEVAINLNNIDDDSQDVTIEANKVGVASVEVGLQMHQNDATGAHAATAISATWTNVQVSLDSIEAAIQSIIIGSGFATEAWVNSTLETNFYTAAVTNATIEAAIAAIPAPSVNQTVTVTAGEALTAGQVVSLINESGTMKAYNIPLTVSTSPNGAESVFLSAATYSFMQAVALDTTRFLVAYIKNSNNQGYAKIGTVSGSTIAWGDESATFAAVSSRTMAACKIGTDKVLVAYSDYSNTKTKMNVLSISGSAITVNGAVDATGITALGTVTQSGLTQLDTDKALLCGTIYDTTYGTATIISVSGTTPSDGTAATFNAAATAYISCSALSATSAIVAYQDGGNSNYGTAQVLSISGTTITAGAEYVFKETGTSYISCCALNSTTGIITTNTDAGNAYAYHFTNSSGTLSYGAENGFDVDNGGAVYHSIASIDATHAILVYKDGTDTVDKNIIFAVSGTSLSASAKYTVNAAQTTYNSVCYLGSNKSAIAYTDVGNSSHGTAVVNEWATASYASVSGISSGAYSSGSDAVVLISGVSDDQTGLITGSPYFLQSDFTVGTTPVSLTSSVYSSAATTREIKIGTAKSATELIIGIDYK